MPRLLSVLATRSSNLVRYANVAGELELSSLLAHLLGADEDRIADDDRVTGLALGTFVATEVMKHASWSATDPSIYHFRDRWGVEVDLVLEDRSGRVAAIEIKAKVSLAGSDTKGLEKLRAGAGERFIAGMVVHAGEQTLPLGDRLWAVPVSALRADQSA